MLNHKKARRAPKIAAFITARLYLCKIKETITIAPKEKKRVPAASPSNPSVSFAEKAVATKIKTNTIMYHGPNEKVPKKGTEKTSQPKRIKPKGAEKSDKRIEKNTVKDRKTSSLFPDSKYSQKVISHAKKRGEKKRGEGQIGLRPIYKIKILREPVQKSLKREKEKSDTQYRNPYDNPRHRNSA